LGIHILLSQGLADSAVAGIVVAVAPPAGKNVAHLATIALPAWARSFPKMNEKDLASSEWVNLITVVVSQSHHHWPTNFYTFVSEPTSAVVAVVVVADVADAVALRHDAHYFAVVGIAVDIEVAVGIDTDAVAEE